MKRNFRLTLFVIWLILAVTIALVIGNINWHRYYRLTYQGIATEGFVLKKEPDNHQNIHYSYVVDQISYSGIGHDGFGNPNFDRLKVGDRIKVFYLSENHAISCLGNPRELLINETIPIIGAAILFPSFIILFNAKRIKRKWFKELE